jgi:cyd operon protein YbgT
LLISSNNQSLLSRPADAWPEASIIWFLGVGFAATFTAMNAIWLELNPGAFERKLAEIDKD